MHDGKKERVRATRRKPGRVAGARAAGCVRGVLLFSVALVFSSFLFKFLKKVLLLLRQIKTIFKQRQKLKKKEENHEKII